MDDKVLSTSTVRTSSATSFMSFMSQIFVEIVTAFLQCYFNNEFQMKEGPQFSNAAGSYANVFLAR
jgi:hypothetical protein